MLLFQFHVGPFPSPESIKDMWQRMLRNNGKYEVFFWGAVKAEMRFPG